jgi:hypothetical protein
VRGSLHALDRIALAYAERLSEQQPRCDLNTGQLPLLAAPLATDLIPVFRNGITYAAAIADIASGFTGGGIFYVLPPTGNATIDTANIQAALSSATFAGGGIVLLEVGIYVISATLISWSNIEICGTTRDGSVIKQANGANLDYMIINGAPATVHAFTPSTTSLTMPGVVAAYLVWNPAAASNYVTNGQAVKHLTLDGNNANQTGGLGFGIYAWGASGFRVDDVKVQHLPHNASSHAVSLWNCAYAKVTRVDCIDVTQGPTLVLACFGCVVDDCIVYSSSDASFAAISNDGGSASGARLTVYGCSYTNCITYSSGTQGFDLAGCIFTVATNCLAFNCTIGGFATHANGESVSTALALANCQAYGCEYGFYIASRRVALSNCYANDCTIGFNVQGSPLGYPTGTTDSLVGEVTFEGCGGDGFATAAVAVQAIIIGGVDCTVKGVTWNGGDLVDPSSTTPIGLYLISYFAGGLDRIFMRGCDLTGIAAPVSTFFSTGGNLPAHYKVESCPGYNPVGAMTPPTPGASPWTYTNATAVDQIINVSGGTVSAISANGVVTGLTAGAFFVPVGKTLVVTYSSVPTVTASGN